MFLVFIFPNRILLIIEFESQDCVQIFFRLDEEHYHHKLKFVFCFSGGNIVLTVQVIVTVEV